MSKPTGHYDVRGIPIHVGDLIRVKHFRHYLRREQMWLYFRVAENKGQFVVQNWHNRDPEHHQCLLSGCGVESSEVLASHELERDKSGCVITFNERERRRE